MMWIGARRGSILATLLLVVIIGRPEVAIGDGPTDNQKSATASKIGLRSFYVVQPTREERAPIGGTVHPYYTSFDIISTEGDTFTIIDRQGRSVTVSKGKHPELVLASVPWDHARNIPTGRDMPDQFFRRYYHFVTSLLIRKWFLISLLLISALYISFAALGEDTPVFPVLGITLPILLILFLLGGHVGRGYQRYLAVYDSATQWLAAYRLPGGHLLPLDYRMIDPVTTAELARGTLYPLWALLWIPLFLVLHVAFAFCLPSFIKGVHYVFVPHPAERHLRPVISGRLLDRQKVVDSVGLGSLENPPPEFISRNKKRRLDALRDRFKAEDGLINAVIDWKRKKAEGEDLAERRPR